MDEDKDQFRIFLRHTSRVIGFCIIGFIVLLGCFLFLQYGVGAELLPWIIILFVVTFATLSPWKPPLVSGILLILVGLTIIIIGVILDSSFYKIIILYMGALFVCGGLFLVVWWRWRKKEIMEPIEEED